MSRAAETPTSPAGLVRESAASAAPEGSDAEIAVAPASSAEVAVTPLESLFELVQRRGMPAAATPDMLRLTDGMISVLALLQGDKERASVALDTISSVSMRAIGDSRAAIRQVTAGHRPASELLGFLHEMSNMATIFVRSFPHTDIYKGVCETIQGIRTTLHSSS